MRKCKLCNNIIKAGKDGYLEDILSPSSLPNYDRKKKDICIDCKKELLFANIITVL